MKEFFKRVGLAIDVLRGRVRHEDSKWFCPRSHVGKDKIVVDGNRLSLLERAADDLKTAVGFIGQAGKHPEYLKVLEQNRK